MTSPASLTLTVPLPPNAANLRRSWRVALREKKAYWRTLDMIYLTALPRAPAAPFDPATIAVHFYVWSLMDPDNAMHRLKPLLDWMKGLYIGDDGPKRLKWAGLPEQTIDRRNQRVVVTVTGEGA